MKGTGKILVVILSVAMILGTLVACSAATPTAAPTAGPTATPAPPVKLTWYFVGTYPQKNQQAVYDAANKIILSQINATVDFQGLNWGDYDTKLKVMISSGESWDLSFTAGWMNDYVGNSANGAFVALDDLFAKSPDTKAFYDSIPTKFWDGVKVNGKIYAAINYNQLCGPGGAITANKSILDGAGVNIDSIKSFNDLEPALKAIKAKYPDIIPLDSWWPQWPTGYEGITGDVGAAAISTLTNDKTVINVYKSQIYKDYIATTKKWAGLGYIGGSDIATLQNHDPLKAQQKVAIWAGDDTFPGVESVLSSNRGYAVYHRTMAQPDGSTNFIITTGWCMNGMEAISRTSKDPLKALQLCAMLNTNVELYNLVNTGIKDVDYTVVSTNPTVIKKIANSGYGDTFNKAMGSPLLSYLSEGQPADYVAQIKATNDSAKASYFTGFVFNPTNVSTQIAAVSSVVQEYKTGFDYGLLDIDKDYAAFIAKLDAAGAQQIIDEAQKQVDAWVAANKK